MSEQQTHLHDADEREMAVDICPLCGTKILTSGVSGGSREDTNRSPEPGASGNRTNHRPEKWREREAAVLAKDAAVRKQLADQVARDTTEALRKQRGLQQAVSDSRKRKKCLPRRRFERLGGEFEQQKKDAQAARTAEMLRIGRAFQRGKSWRSLRRTKSTRGSGNGGKKESRNLERANCNTRLKRLGRRDSDSGARRSEKCLPR